MTEQPGNSPWSPQAGGAAGSGPDAPTAMPSASALASTTGGTAQPGPPKSNWLKVVVAINAAIVLIGAAVIVVLLMNRGDDGSDVAIVDDGPSTSSSRDPDTDQGRDGDGSTTAQESSTTQSDGPVELEPNDTTVNTTIMDATTAVPSPTAAPVTLPPRTTPPPTQPPAPAIPGPDEALGQVRTTLTEFMAADNQGDIDAAMGYLAPPVEMWVDSKAPLGADALRSDIGDPKSANIALSVADGPSLAFGPEPTADGGWMIKVNYTLHAEGSYLKKTGGTGCYTGDQGFLDTLVAAPGGIPRITNHVQTSDSGNSC